MLAVQFRPLAKRRDSAIQVVLRWTSSLQTSGADSGTVFRFCCFVAVLMTTARRRSFVLSPAIAVRWRDAIESRETILT